MADDVAAFLSHHTINLDEWPWGRALLEALLAGREATSRSITSAPASVLEGEPVFGLLYQLGERACEHIAGSIACFATKNAASAELAARAAVEISVNIRFMLSGDRNSRVAAWIRDFVRNDEKLINHWEKSITHLSEAEKQACAPRIATRRKLQELRRGWSLDAEKEFLQFGPLNLNEPWPKIVDRFEQIGEAVAYRTAYARLSSQTHADAEDTLNYIFFTTNRDEEKLSQMARETVAFTQYLIAYGAFFYLSAMKTFCEAFKLNPATEIDASIAAVLRGMHEVADVWKW
jgi:Family of unknown function (DUF5677)